MTATKNRDRTHMTITDSQPPNDERPARPCSNVASSLLRTLASERIKLTTVRSNRIILGLTIAIGMFVSWAVATFVTDEVLTVAEVFSFSIVFTAVFASVAGTSSSRHQIGLPLNATTLKSALRCS